MKKFLLGLALISVMALGTTAAYAGGPQKKAAPAKTEQTATMKKAGAKAPKTCPCGPKCDKKKCTKACKCAKPCDKKKCNKPCKKAAKKACNKKCAK
jgi:hypothetical protein